MSRAGRTASLILSALALCSPGRAASQLPLPDSVLALPAIGGIAEDDERLAQLLGRAGTEGYLLRSPSSRLPRTPRWALLAPSGTVRWSSTLPLSLNDGSLWAGKGLNLQLTSGVAAAAGRVRLVLAPELTYSENASFQLFPGGTPERSIFASPFYGGAWSADLPLRFGGERLAELRPGESSLSVAAGPVTLGAATESQWWGPGIRNAIVMSNNAGGFPHLFLRTSRPVATRFGEIEAKWIDGALVESLFFDTVSNNDVRSLSGVAATFRPRSQPGLTLGLSRVVYGRVEGASRVLARALDVLTWWGSPTIPAPTDSLALPTGAGSSREQILSLFGRWVFPRDGIEVYAEWSRLALPSSLSDLLNQPEHSQGYTLGLQWAKPLGEDVFRLQTETTYLEESATFDNRPVPRYYVSASIPQGYTHRGQVVGAAIGPGASSQWLAGDYIRPRWRLGLFGSRVRWNNDIYYAKPGRTHVAHDVSLYGGVRGGMGVGGFELDAELVHEYRYNYLFQNQEREPNGEFAVDRRNTALRLTVTPRR